MHVVQETSVIKVEVYEPSGEDLTDEQARECAEKWLVSTRGKAQAHLWPFHDIERKNYNRAIVHFGGL